MTSTEPEVCSISDTAVEQEVSRTWKICPIMKELCIEAECKFWDSDECLIVKIIKEWFWKLR